MMTERFGLTTMKNYGIDEYISIACKCGDVSRKSLFLVCLVLALAEKLGEIEALLEVSYP